MELSDFYFFFFFCGFPLFYVPRATGRPVPISLTVFARPGEDVVLQCSPTSLASLSSNLVVEWLRVNGSTQLIVLILRDGKELVKEKAQQYVKRSVPTEDYSLKLLDVRPADNGTYRCVLLKGAKEEHSESVSLIVAQVSAVNISTYTNPSSELIVVCQSSGWYPEPLVSLLDSDRKDLHAETESSVGPDGLFSFRTLLHVNREQATLTGNGTVLCRVKIRGMDLVEEKAIDVGGGSIPQTVGSHQLVRHRFLIICSPLLFVFIVFIVWMFWRKKKQPLEQNDTGDGSGDGSELQKLSQTDAGGGAANDGAEMDNKAYVDVMKMETTGASGIAKARRLSVTGVEASHRLAEKDLAEMLKYREVILAVGKARHIHPALIAAIISRQSQAGTSLRSDGFGKFDSDSFGLMQINRHYHPIKGGPFSREHVDQGVALLCALIHIMKRENQDWTREQHIKGALACYMAGEDKVIGLKYEDVDSVTPYCDFANDVIARAQWFAVHDF
ncbi:uncharacterized protein LOC121504399 isoform X2 [Cheilinus undulatus]|uniref:uncharacterized protein LOC121504399 isoform X2 n=1 Tax=Cheilinus undulatus TaxID=241271 RepID=UPI001BD602A1|nr:uncharacterized protein LOC121504399 isoform X2 [Cheilinus undulatus]